MMTKIQTNNLYRNTSCAIVFNKKNQILLGNRIDSYKDSWQFAQGGIEKDETIKEAAKRELFEEMSVKSVQLIYTNSEGYCYDFSDDIIEKFAKYKHCFKGQCIYFNLFYFYGDEKEININTQQPEFKNYKWGNFDDAINTTIFFKKGVYLIAKEKFLPIIDEFIKNLS